MDLVSRLVFLIQSGIFAGDERKNMKLVQYSGQKNPIYAVIRCVGHFKYWARRRNIHKWQWMFVLLDLMCSKIVEADQ